MASEETTSKAKRPPEKLHRVNGFDAANVLFEAMSRGVKNPVELKAIREKIGSILDHLNFCGYWIGVEELSVTSTPLHDLVEQSRAQGLHVDVSIYGPDEGRHPDSDDTWSDYIGGSRITGYDGDPMDVIANGVKALKDRAKENKTS